MNPPLTVRVDDLSGPEIAQLLTEHLRALDKVTVPESRHALDLDGLRQPDVTFWSVWRGDALAGCGALKQLDSHHGEVKSMRTVKAHLRNGVASLVLSTIITEARRRGYGRLSLETGATSDFTAAHGLYRKFGFKDCQPFASYRPDPNSRFFTLELDGTSGLTRAD